jgi:hypothetical protein
MNERLEVVIRVAAIGAGATVIMDIWAALLRRVGIPSLDLALLGRWIGHIPEGRLRHDAIAKAPPVKAERALGWAAHYAIGVIFAGLLVFAYGSGWARSPSPGPALVVGLGTVVAPLFILQPALGAGVASSRTPRPVFNALKSVVTHLVFGAGLYLAALVAAALLPA